MRHCAILVVRLIDELMLAPAAKEGQYFNGQRTLGGTIHWHTHWAGRLVI